MGTSEDGWFSSLPTFKKVAIVALFTAWVLFVVFCMYFLATAWLEYLAPAASIASGGAEVVVQVQVVLGDMQNLTSGDDSQTLTRLTDFGQSLTEGKELAIPLIDLYEELKDQHGTEDSFTEYAMIKKRELEDISQDTSGFTGEYYEELDLGSEQKSGFNRCANERELVGESVINNLVVGDYYGADGSPVDRPNFGDDTDLEALYNCYTKSTCGYDTQRVVDELPSPGVHECGEGSTLSINPGLIECSVDSPCTDASCCGQDINPSLFICREDETEDVACNNRICRDLDFVDGTDLAAQCVISVGSIRESLSQLLTIEIDAIILQILSYIDSLETKGRTETQIVGEIGQGQEITTYVELFDNGGRTYTVYKEYLNQLLALIQVLDHRTWPDYSDYIASKNEEEDMNCYDNKDTMDDCLKDFFPKSEEIGGTTYTISEEDWNTECERQFEANEGENDVIDNLVLSENPRSYQLNRLLLNSDNTDLLKDDICSGTICTDQVECRMSNSPQRTVANNFGNMMDNFKQYSMGTFEGDSLIGDDQTFGIYTTYFKEDL